MNAFNPRLACALGALTFLSCLGHAPDASAQASAGGIDVAQQPLFTQSGQPPLNMLVMGKDHKIYYEAYNDASDLNGDGALDIGYKPATLDYYGYFNSFVCYTWSAGNNRFQPAAATTNKQCSGQWSGDFLNYLTTSRMDALRRVLYGGWRHVDSTTDTTLQGAFFPQDGHSWGKEYQSIARDGYDISHYAPLSVPAAGRYHLFAVTTVTGNANTYPNYQAPLFRVLKDTDKRVWNWLSIEGPVAGNRCFTASNTRVDCVPAAATGTWGVVPASMLSGVTITTYKRTQTSPGNLADMNTMFSTHSTAANRCGTGAISVVNTTGSNNNPFVPGTNSCTQDNYFTLIQGNITVPADGTYRFAVDGDDAVDLRIGTTDVANWYGPHGSDRSDANLLARSGTIYLTAGTYTFRFRHKEDGGGDNWGLFMFTPAINASRDDYYVRVQSCPSSNAALRESTCKAYPNGQFKPTGILHDYGETSRMYFGLITGSQFNNLEGGVLRRNMRSFGDEIIANTGQFDTTVNGIANTISKLRMIGGGYGGGTTDNMNSDSNWNWANGTGTCVSQGDRALNNAECRMWGNPLAEMLYESMRYFAGAAAPTARFNANTSGGGATAGNNEETTLGLTKATWKDPYAAAPDGGGFLACAKPYQTIISDINPSYDGDLPGSPFTGAITTTSTTPSTISSFNAASEGQAIWNAEFGAGSRSVFIGDVANVTDGAPTAKTASSFGNIRGLSPEEPTKGGTYFSASVARYARLADVNAISGQQNLSTYAIALASPLPRIEFPVGDGKITLLPFAKTASGTFGTGTRKPTNTIVDFYVESIANLPGQPSDALINAGRPYAVFRINYEDVEQGNDHDMDAIVRYVISANADGTVTVTLNSEYAAGSADQNMGYVMSGTTQDGVYLDVRDTDSGAGSFLAYILNTPNPILPGGCNPVTLATACNSQLPLNSTRVFTPAAAGAAGGTTILNDPLWYAAKYGAPTANWDADNDGTPDNYFLVTNPATLRTQLDRAFANIIDTSQPTASVATSTPRFVAGATLAYSASYASSDWSGDVQAYELRQDGSYYNQPVTWSASQRMPAPNIRKIFTAEIAAGATTGVPFTTLGLSTATETRIQGTLDPAIFDTGELINYLRGDKSNEQGATGCTVPSDCPYRARSSRLGDILNSTPAVIGVTSFGYGSILRDIDPDAADEYVDFVDAKKDRFGAQSESPVIFVGANDGMLHALNGSEGAAGGTELFAYIPHAVQGNLQELARPGYVHRFFVDGSPTVSDAYFGSWRTVLLGSTGAGARAVYALDVTDPYTFDEGDVMWEFNDSIDARMGQFVGRPYMGITEDGTWIATFGNGLNSRTPAGAPQNVDNHAVLFIRNLETGAEIATIPTNWGCSTTLPAANSNACSGADTAGNNRFAPNGLATAVLVDNDGNGLGDTIYAGDYLGNLWRFEQDKTTGAWTLGNGGVPLFTARDPGGKRQSITSGAYTVANPFGGTMVVFGTGRYLNADDADETRIGLGSRAAMDTIYGIWDARLYVENEDGSPGAWYQLNAVGQPVGTRTDLEPQRVTDYTPMVDGADGYRMATRNPVNYRSDESPTGKMGWYMDLSFVDDGTDLLAGERVTATPQGILTDVVFNTFRPEGDTCEPGSQNATMVLDSLTGSAAYTPVEPAGGWPGGQEPPEGALVGTDTRRGPPPGEPPIVIVRPPLQPGVPSLCPEDDPDCHEPPVCDPATEECVWDEAAGVWRHAILDCKWVSPNSAERMAGKAIPCGRISWKQIR